MDATGLRIKAVGGCVGDVGRGDVGVFMVEATRLDAYRFPPSFLPSCPRPTLPSLRSLGE